MAKRFEDAGADGLTFHPRVAPDRRAHRPKWEYIGLVKSAVRIPVFGNGNVFSDESCLQMISGTGCDGVAVGRMAVARPWILAQWSGRFPSDVHPYLETALDYIDLISTHFETKDALRRFIRFSLYFSANFRFGHTLYSKISNARDFGEVRSFLLDFFKTPPAVNSRPNMNFLR
jgi:tRNA-dihydrouridine synthase